MQVKSKTEIMALMEHGFHGDSTALEELMPMMGEELERIARNRFKGRDTYDSAKTITVINQLSIKLTYTSPEHLENRLHFFVVAVTNLRRVLVDQARAYLFKTLTGADSVESQVTTTPLTLGDHWGPREVIQLDEVLDKFRELDPRSGLVMDFRYFLGLNNVEVAGLLCIGTDEVNREWILGKAWLKRALQRGDV